MENTYYLFISVIFIIVGIVAVVSVANDINSITPSGQFIQPLKSAPVIIGGIPKSIIGDVQEIEPNPEIEPGQTEAEAFSTFMDTNSPPGVADFYGTDVELNDEPVPVGIVIQAKTELDQVCGEFIVNNQLGAGQYGFLHCSCGGAYDPPCECDNSNPEKPDCPDGGPESWNIEGTPITFYVDGKDATLIGPHDNIWQRDAIKHVNMYARNRCSDGTAYNTCLGYAQRPRRCSESPNTPNYLYIEYACDICGCPGPVRNPDFPGPGEPKYLYYNCCPRGDCALEFQVCRAVIME